MSFIRAFGKKRTPMINFRKKLGHEAGSHQSSLIDEHKFINAPSSQQPSQTQSEKPLISFKQVFDYKPDVFKPRPIDLEIKESDAINGYIDVPDWNKIKSIKL